MVTGLSVMPSHNGHTRSGAKLLAQFSVVLLFVVVFIALLGALIYALYRVALVDRRLYSYLFAGVFSGFLVFLAIRSVRRGTFTRFLLKVTKVLFGLALAAAVAGFVMLYAALLIRRPFIGAACLPPLVGGVLLMKIKLRFFAQLKNIFHKL